MKGQVLALSGGVGGAKLVLGLARILDADDLVVIANTGDDFRHLGFDISPDVDTLLYTLAGLADPLQGWGRHDETWNFMAALERLGGETWFRLGDADLAMHVERTRRIAAGETLTAITDDLRQRLGVTARIAPMTDDMVRTQIVTDAGRLDFQTYFVRRHCKPVASCLQYLGAESATPSPVLLDALSDAHLRAVVICPSNPYLSIEPILAMPAVRKALALCSAPVIAVSPIIGNQAVKGPTAKLMKELGQEVSSATIARHYRGLIDALVVDVQDAQMAAPADIELVVEPTLMLTLEDRERLARAVLVAADRMSATPKRASVR